MFNVGSSRARAHEDSIWCVEWTKGNKIVTGSVDESISFWDPEDLASPLSQQVSHQLAVVGLAASGDGKRVVSSSMDGFLRVYDTAKGELLRSFDAGQDGTWPVSYHPTAQHFASGTKSGSVCIYDANDEGSDAARVLTDADRSFIISVRFSPSGSHIASGNVEGSVNLWDTERGAVVNKLPGHVKSVRALSFSPDGRLLFAGCDDSYISVYDVVGGQQIRSIAAHKAWVLGVEACPAGGPAPQFASSGTDRKVKLWDLRTYECQHVFEAHTDQIWDISYSPDGSKLASVGDDRGLVVCSTGQGSGVSSTPAVMES